MFIIISMPYIYSIHRNSDEQHGCHESHVNTCASSGNCRSHASQELTRHMYSYSSTSVGPCKRNLRGSIGQEISLQQPKCHPDQTIAFCQPSHHHQNKATKKRQNAILNQLAFRCINSFTPNIKLVIQPKKQFS